MSLSPKDAARAVNAALHRAVADWMEANLPKWRAYEITLYLRDPATGTMTKTRFPIDQVAGDAVDTAEPETPMEQDILTALGNDTLRGEEICERSGYSWGGRFRSRLARMVAAGLLVKVADGYKQQD